MNNAHPDKLIYDVGMHTGEDTAYYLHRGFKVLAIEANPELAQRAEKKFAAAIAADRLNILQIGIAAREGEADFYISTGKSVWSSFDKANATKNGSGFKVCRLQCRTFTSILEEYGTPAYLKVDIEGSDHLCIEALSGDRRPAHVSCELSHEKSGRMIQHLSGLGYKGFKFVRQNDLRVLQPEQLDDYLAGREKAQRLGLVGHVQRRYRNIRLRISRPKLDGWRFPKGASGPFGADLEGRWTTAEQATGIWQALTEADQKQRGAALGDWFDIHAQR